MRVEVFRKVLELLKDIIEEEPRVIRPYTGPIQDREELDIEKEGMVKLGII